MTRRRLWNHQTNLGQNLVWSRCSRLLIGLVYLTASGHLVLSGPVAAVSRSALAWETCNDANDQPVLECSTLDVPVDYTKPGGKHFKIAVMKRNATDRANRIGSLVINPGGPGLSGVAMLRNVADRAGFHFGDNVAARFDLVGFDPRGVSPDGIRCATDAQIDQLSFGPSSPAGSATALDRACAKKYNAATYSTESVARDLERLRVSLGDSSLNFYGASYGATIGSTYASMFPNRVRVLILDSPYLPDTTTTDRWQSGDLAPFEASFARWVNWCNSEATCTGLIGEPKRAWESLATQLRRNPIILESPRLAATERVLAMGTSAALYRSTDWPDLASAIAAALDGRGNELFDLAADYAGRGSDGSWGSSPQTTLLISCASGLRGVAAPVDPAAALVEIHRAAPHFAAMVAPDDLVPPCAAMTPIPPRQRIGQLRHGLALIVSGTHDPATPLAMGMALQTKLGSRATMVINERDGHVQRRSNSCVTAIIESAVVDLVVPASGTRCM
jgi:pimeloyl-ACP methyl ester carboxylesterase